jgi:hypothetical protein
MTITISLKKSRCPDVPQQGGRKELCLLCRVMTGSSACLSFVSANILQTKSWGLDGTEKYRKVNSAAELCTRREYTGLEGIGRYVGHQTQNPVGLTPRVGSIPAFGTRNCHRVSA